MNRSTLSRIAAACLCAAALSAQAQSLTNGNFSAGLVGWQVLGDVSAPAAPAGLPLWLTTASLAFEDDSPLAAGALNRSGTAAADVALVESFTGVASGALDPDGANGLSAYEGSATRQSFVAQAGDSVSFRWNFGTSDTFADYAFAVIDGQFIRLGGVAEATAPGSNGQAAQTGEATYSAVFTSSGIHQLSFGVVDAGDYGLTSTLSIGNVQVSAVPEAPSLLLLLAGTGILALRSRRQRP